MPDHTERHDATQRARALFDYDHLSPELQQLSAQFANLADTLIAVLPDDAMLRESLIKLWESKNCAVYVAARIGYAGLSDIALPPAGYSTDAPHTRET
jgi:hypothetical protein